MSRTYRRTQKGRKATWLPEISDCDISGYGRLGYVRPDQKAIEFLEKHPKYINDVGNFFHWMTTPSHWHHEHQTVPRRARERALMQKIKKGELDSENVSWPDGKKPYSYYW
jgi:hypothetical protein